MTTPGGHITAPGGHMTTIGNYSGFDCGILEAEI